VNQRLQGTLVGLAIMFVFVALGVRRRMRPQPVRPNRIVLFSVLIVLLVGLSFVGTGAHLIENPLAIALAPVCLAIGVVLGFFLVRTMRFWTDPDTGRLWMAGGALFAIILVGTILLRLGARYAVTGDPFAAPKANESVSPLSVLSADLLFVTIGLWLSRAVLLVLRHRDHVSGQSSQHSENTL
jgi:membrane protein CcdC involved in cytochrome C biogenesis